VAATRTVFGLKDHLSMAIAEATISELRIGDRGGALYSRVASSNPIASELFGTLRELRRAFGRGGIPPMERRTPEDEVRIASFCALQEFVHILDQFRRSIEKGEYCHLVIRELRTSARQSCRRDRDQK
jgi:hypothetical protein